MSYQSVADCLYFSEINLMISLTQFLHYDVFKVHSRLSRRSDYSTSLRPVCQPVFCLFFKLFRAAFSNSHRLPPFGDSFNRILLLSEDCKRNSQSFLGFFSKVRNIPNIALFFLHPGYVREVPVLLIDVQTAAYDELILHREAAVVRGDVDLAP